MSICSANVGHSTVHSLGNAEHLPLQASLEEQLRGLRLSLWEPFLSVHTNPEHFSTILQLCLYVMFSLHRTASATPSSLPHLLLYGPAAAVSAVQ